LDVKYQEWTKGYEAVTPENPLNPRKDFQRPKNNLREVWTPVHTFSNGRIAMVAVMFLLQNGYVMSEEKPK
jgi:hypothetical protein